MKYNLDFSENVIVISADRYGRFSSIEKLMDDVLNLKKHYRVDAVKVNSSLGKEIDTDNFNSDELKFLFTIPKPKYCPECNLDMEEGICYATDLSFGGMFDGRSHKDVVFEDGNNKTYSIIKYEEFKKSFHCTSCGLIMIL